MQFKRAFFLLFPAMIHHFASGIWVRSDIASLAALYFSHRTLDSRSIGLSFHCLSGSVIRKLKRRFCSSSVMEDQYLMRIMPDFTIVRSNSGTERKNSSTCSALLFASESHYALNTGSVVPTPIKEHDLAGGGQVVNIALEVPLRALPHGRLLQSDDATDSRV